ncbi:TPA: hypothetical protein ACIR07_004461 [Enterobacter hormaechei]
MKLPKHAPESTLINSAELHFEYNKTGSRERKSIQYQLIKNNNPVLNYLKKLTSSRIISKPPSRFSTYLPPNTSGVH